MTCLILLNNAGFLSLHRTTTPTPCGHVTEIKTIIMCNYSHRHNIAWKENVSIIFLKCTFLPSYVWRYIPRACVFTSNYWTITVSQRIMKSIYFQTFHHADENFIRIVCLINILCFLVRTRVWLCLCMCLGEKWENLANKTKKFNPDYSLNTISPKYLVDSHSSFYIHTFI